MCKALGTCCDRQEMLHFQWWRIVFGSSYIQAAQKPWNEVYKVDKVTCLKHIVAEDGIIFF